ncbi:MAG: NADH-quinone oxidoreductase subunit L [Verrucomicrobiaceae bacterium]|nr:NADH-quinone oxidoreductase subunit L [Verrucomicrobiaceae bacterium]
MTIASIILLLPLIAAIAILLFTRKRATLSAYVSVISAGVCFLLTLGLISGSGEAGSFTWLRVGGLELKIALEITGLTKGMILVVTAVGLLVHIFSLGYMKDDAAKARYFTGLSLFMFSMTGIVLADNFAMMFIFWELVGVSSYLLIGHWFQKNSAAEASKKAFLVNRIGDFGFMAGILLLWGATGEVSFSGLEQVLDRETFDPALLNWAMICIFCGAVGKSAQVPLHVWLPDAMEGPTPVSALIHAATMVAAGVFMLAKVTFLIIEAPVAASVIQHVGALTALVAALMATQQSDIKKILAYSTLSQLGYMVMAVGFAGFVHSGDVLGASASNAGFFHLYTHAFFKALLFLGAGAVIYACHHEQDIWKMGGLLRLMPVTAITFLIGTAALAGLPPLSGFWSKDAVMAAAQNNTLLLIVGAMTAFLTAFYMSRLCTIVFLGKARSQASGKATEVPLVMRLPLVILAAGAVLSGFKFAYGWFLNPDDLPHPHGALPLVLTVIGIAGILAGYMVYRGRDRDPIKVEVFARKFYIDEIYLCLVRLLQDGLAYLAKAVDQLLIDGLIVRGSARLTSGVGSLLRGLQGGNLQSHAFLFGLGIVVIIYLITITFK